MRDKWRGWRDVGYDADIQRHTIMIPLPPRLLPPDGKGRGKTVPCWGIVQPSELRLEGRVLLLIVDKDGEPLPIRPNPRWYPVELIEDYKQ